MSGELDAFGANAIPTTHAMLADGSPSPVRTADRPQLEIRSLPLALAAIKPELGMFSEFSNRRQAGLGEPQAKVRSSSKSQYWTEQRSIELSCV